MSRVALQQLTSCSPQFQLQLLAWLHRAIKQRLAQLNLAKLSYYERGDAQAWQHQYDELTADAATIEAAIEALFPAPPLPFWI